MNERRATAVGLGAVSGLAGLHVRDGSLRTPDGERLRDVRLDVPARGTTVILGQRGSGKSALLAALCGQRLPNGWSASGLWSACGVSLPTPNALPIHFPLRRRAVGLRTGMGESSVRLDTPWETLANLRGIVALDSPDELVDADKHTELAAAIRAVAADGAVVLCTSSAAFARRVADRILFIAGEQIHYQGGAGGFFRRPSRVVAHFLERSAHAVAPAGITLPGHFRWVVQSRLGAMQHPGSESGLSTELGALSAGGVSCLVNLTEESLFQKELRPYALSGWHFPLLRYATPRLDDTSKLCHRIGELIRRSRPVALHCDDGVARCGLVAACYLVWEGESVEATRDRLGLVDVGFLSDSLHVDYLQRFAEYCARTGGAPPPESGTVRRRRGT